MKAFWSRIARELSPYVPGEQPRIANLVKLNTNENPTHDRGAAGFGASLPSAHVAAIDRICVGFRMPARSQSTSPHGGPASESL